MQDHKYGGEINRTHFEKFALKAGANAIVILNGSQESAKYPDYVKAS